MFSVGRRVGCGVGGSGLFLKGLSPFVAFGAVLHSGSVGTGCPSSMSGTRLERERKRLQVVVSFGISIRDSKYSGLL